MGLIGDLFPALNVPRKRDLEFEDWVKKSIIVRLKCAQDFFQEFSDGGNERKGIVGGVTLGAWLMGVANYAHPRGGKTQPSYWYTCMWSCFVMY